MTTPPAAPQVEQGTPRTDSMEPWNLVSGIEDYDRVPTAFARQLERELRAAETKLAECERERLSARNAALKAGFSGGDLAEIITELIQRASQAESRAAAAEKDVKRLDWVMRSVSGKEWRRLGVMADANCNRAAIDAAHHPGGKNGDKL